MTHHTPQIQPDMIALEPEFVGSLAPVAESDNAGDGQSDIPYARLPRYERLRVSGKADEADEVEGEGEGEADGGEEGKRGKQASRAEREKRKMRGKGKSMKRSAFTTSLKAEFFNPAYSIADTYASSGRTLLIRK